MRKPLLGVLFLPLLLAACATTTVVREEPAPAASPRPAPAPRPASAPVPAGPAYEVRAGDTLYGIAFRNRLDWRELARWNDIPEPYLIRVGQVLRLSPPAPAAPPPIPRGPAGSAGAVVQAPPPPPAGPVPPASSGAAVFRPGQWQWPTQGQVVSRYAEGDKARQGIAIAGTAGQPVRAAAAGTVVYSGAGLVGYGELIIIKHDDEWLSAYGHNRRRLVAEGATVIAGQQIAELGRTGTSRDMLHFEIRRNGRPVDPLPLLPAR
ncbi:MAG: lipoprotein [Silanimonas sp.]|nr:MAG: lipoprotein [Silanimonas sp.]